MGEAVLSVLVVSIIFGLAVAYGPDIIKKIKLMLKSK